MLGTLLCQVKLGSDDLQCENNGEENCSSIIIYVINSSFYYFQFKEIEMIPMLTQFTFQ